MERRLRLAILALIVGLVGLEAQSADANVSASTANLSTLWATSLYSPTAPAGVPAGRNVNLSWTASVPQNGNGYVVSGTNIGRSVATACPTSAAAYAFVGGSATASFTDSTSLAGGTDGTYVCYLVRSGQDASAPSTWSVDPTWASNDALPAAKSAIGFFATSLTFANGGTANRLDASDTIVINFDQSVDLTSVGTISFICASVTSSTIYLGITGGTSTCPTAASIGRLTGMTLSNALNADGRYAATGLWSNGDATLTITVGALSAGWRRVLVAAGTEAFRPATAITSATGAVAICITVVCRPTTTGRP
jgi:hypothetical protein